MTCANCDALRHRIARLERELNLRHAEGVVPSIMQAFNLSASAARIVAALYNAAGRAGRIEHLIETASLGSDASLRTMIYRSRNALPKGSMTALYGIGYQLEPIGLSAVLAAIQPVEIQDVRAA